MSAKEYTFTLDQLNGLLGQMNEAIEDGLKNNHDDCLLKLRQTKKSLVELMQEKDVDKKRQSLPEHRFPRNFKVKPIEDLEVKPGYTAKGERTADHDDYLNMCDDIGLRNNLIGKPFSIRNYNYWFAGYNIHRDTRRVAVVCADLTKFGTLTYVKKSDLPIEFFS